MDQEGPRATLTHEAGVQPDEYQALRAGAGLVERGKRARFTLCGPDRAAFLHGILSEDVADIRPGQSAYGLFLTVKGKVAAAMNVHALPDCLLLDVPAAAAQTAWDTLDQYLILEDVEIDDASARLAPLALHGPAAPDLLRQALYAAPPAGFGEVRVLGDLIVAGASGGANDLGVEGFDLFAPPEQAAALRRQLLALGARPVGWETAEVVRVEAGIPRFGAELDENVLPLEAGLERAVSFTKGCFPGAEVLSRLHHRGHVNRTLWGLELGDQPLPAHGAEVWAAGRRRGQVTSAVRSPLVGGAIALAYVHRDHARPGAPVEVRHGSLRLPATVRPLPFTH